LRCVCIFQGAEPLTDFWGIEAVHDELLYFEETGSQIGAKHILDASDFYREDSAKELVLRGCFSVLDRLLLLKKMIESNL
jgi:hypothetical protein